MKTIYDIRDLKELSDNSEMLCIYFSNDACNVCKVLKPKIIEMVASRFPKLTLVYVDTEKSPVIAGQYRVFSIPTIDIYVQGKEHARFSRNVTMYDLEASINKPYSMLFSE